VRAMELQPGKVRKLTAYIVFGVVTVVMTFLNAYASALTGSPAIIVGWLVAWGIVGQMILRQIARSGNPK